MDNFLTPDQLMARWNGTIGKGTLANWRAKGRGPYYVKIGGKVLYPVAEVQKWETDNLKQTNK